MGLAKTTLPPQSPGTHRLQTAVFALAIFAATLGAYLPCIHGGILWDDEAHITAPSLQSLEGLGRIWFHVGATQQYYPVLHSAFWLEHRIWGDSVLGYHLVNIALHAAAACLFALTLARIRSGQRERRSPLPGEWLAAAVFALHPVCVESVAWISEQKNTLSLVFYLLSALAYLRFDSGRRRTWYALSLALFVLALLSKSVTATLPAALLLVLSWRRGGLSWKRDVAPLLPWFIVGAFSGLFTAWVERHYIGANGQDFALGPIERCFLAGRIFWFYVGKLFWPTNLMFIYPRWRVQASVAWSLGCLGLAALIAVLWVARRRTAGPLVAVLFFLGSLFPALGFFNVYPFVYSYVADHWQYLPSLGMIALAAVGGTCAAKGFVGALEGPPRMIARWVLVVAAACLLAVFFGLTRAQSALYSGVSVLYRDTLSKNPGCWMAHNNLGKYLMDTGSPEDGVAHVREAIRLNPGFALAHNNLGAYLMRTGSGGEGISEFETALRLEPNLSDARVNLGSALLETPGRATEGIEELQASLHGNLGDHELAGVHEKLGGAFARIPGRLPEAMFEFEAVLQIEPGNLAARGSLGIALARSGRPLEAVAQFERALQMDPENPKMHNDLGIVLTALGRMDEAVGHFRRALQLSPGFPEAQHNLDAALREAAQ